MLCSRSALILRVASHSRWSALGRVGICQLTSHNRSFSSSDTGAKLLDAVVNPGMHQTPIVDRLWRARSEKTKIKGDGTSSTTEASRVSITYEFSKDPLLRDRYSNPWGFIRMGRVLEDLDALAGNIAANHCIPANSSSEFTPPLIVTASVDRIQMKHRANLRDDMTLSGYVAWVGSSSMQIHMSATSCWSNTPWLTANFVFVARDPNTGKPWRIPDISPSTEEDKNHMAFLDSIHEKRKLARLSAKEKQKSSATAMFTLPDSAAVALTQSLLDEARSTMNMPALANPNFILQDQTRMSNVLICQPQQRNTRGRIFGGFLMRRAFELAFSTAYMFSGCHPIFREVDRVDFKKPVEVGNMLRFESTVLYTSHHPYGMEHSLDNVAKKLKVPAPVLTARYQGALLHVAVDASIVNPEEATSVESNTFHFTFEIRDKPLKKVLPSTLEQAHKTVSHLYYDIQQELDST